MKASWKARAAALAMAAAIMAGYSLPVYAAGAEGAEPAATVQTGSDDAAPTEQASEDTPTAAEQDTPAADDADDTAEATPAPAEDTDAAPAPEVTPAPTAETPATTKEEAPAAAEEETAPEAAAPEAAAVTGQIPVVQAASTSVSALWEDDFSETITTTNANVKKAWKGGIVPKNWDSIWIANAPADYDKTYWEVVEDASYTGGKAMHLHSEDAGSRLVIASAAQGLDYSKEYVLRMRVKTQDLTKLQFRTQIGDKGNIYLTATDVPAGTTSDWTTVELALTGMQDVYDAFANAKTNENGNLKIEIFSAAGTTGDVWIDTIDIVSKEDSDASKGDVLWSNSFDEAVTATGNAAKYFVDGLGPKNFMGAWIPEVPDTDKFQLKLDDTTKVSGSYSLYAKSTYPNKAETGTISKQRLKLASTDFPTSVDYTRSYVLRAKVKLNNAGNSNWGGAALRVDLASGSISSDPRLLGTSDWQTVELKLSADQLQSVSGKTSGKMEISVMYEYFTGEMWVDDMELIALPYTLTINESDITLQPGETKQLTTNAPSTDTVTWTSSDDTVATVSADGVVTGVKGGVATITASVGESNVAECTVSVTDPAAEADFKVMRDKWTERLTGNSYWKGDATTSQYKTILAGYDDAAKAARDNLVTDSTTVLFSDLDLDFQKKLTNSPNSTNTNDSVAFSTAISRIQDMARAWAAEGSAYYHDESLKNDILYAMEWAYSHFYNENLNNQAMFGNWYHWWIGMPQSLAGTVILMHDEMSADLLAREAATLAHFNEDPAYVYKVKGAAGKMTMTGANLADTSLASLLRGAACSDQKAVINGTKYFDDIAKVVSSGEGIYADGSFIQHTNLAYTGGYGATLLNGVEKLVYLTSDSDSWAISDTQLATIYNWIWDGIRPLYANGAMFDMVGGRGISRPTSSDLKTGRGILAGVVLLSESAPADRKGDIQSFAKAQLQAGAEIMGADDYYSGMNAAAMMASLTLVNDDSIEAKANTGYSKVFGGMDKAVAHTDTFDFGISYASGRTGRTEFGNGENSKGWHQSDGATYLYNGDPTQFSDSYWPTVDPQRLAGITTDHSTWSLAAWGNYPGNANFNGGSSVGVYANVGMNFNNYSTSSNKSLNAHKAWFVFDDEIVAMGSVNGIDSSRTTETIVENKKINGNNKLVVDGETTASNIGDTASLEDAHWAWLEGNNSTDSVGYYFPGGTKLNVLREERTGKWTDINSTAGDSTEYTRDYLSLAVPHGFNTDAKLSSFKNEYYSYVLLPSKTQEEVKAYAENPDIEILANSSMVQAVRDNKANVTGYLFWGDQNKEIRVGDVGAVKGSVTVVKDVENHTMTVGMADVHQTNDSLTFRVYGNGIDVVSADEGVTVTTDKYGAKMVVNTAGAKGKTFTVTLSYRDLTEDEVSSLASIRENYVNSQTGNNMADKTDAQYRAVVDGYSAAAKEALEHLNRNAGKGTNLFDDIDNQLDWTKGSSNTDGSANLTSVANRIKALTLAYASEGCTEYYHNESLKNDILFCFDYLNTGFPSILNYQDKVYANWWDWSIGVPKALTTAGVLMYDELGEAGRSNLHSLISLLVPDSTYYWGRSSNGRGYIATATAANKAELAMIMALNGLIGDDPTQLMNASATQVDSLKYVTSGEGFYEDGSYKQHGNFGYNGAYGVEMLRGVTQIASLTDNTPWAAEVENPNIIYEWILNAFRPLYADGGIFDMVQGRSVSRYNRSYITTGRYAMDAILTLAANAPDEYRDQIYSFAKTQAALGIAYDADSYYAKLRFSSLIMAKNLLADDSIPLDTEVYTKVYGSMDKAVVHSDKFALGINMFSSRNGATECGNSENLKGWYTGDGMLTLSIGDQAQFDKGYWATVDPLRLNGITTNHVTAPLNNFSIKANDRDWVGGSTIEGTDYASIGQDFKSNYSDLQAKKSWFAFGDQIVALGAGISTTEGDDAAETIVENRRIDNSNTLIVNGASVVAENGSDTVKADWAWLSANQAGLTTGYYFPESVDLNVQRETRTGQWSDINQNSYPKDDTNTVTNDYITMAVSHGVTPTDGSYSYVLLPGKSQEETAAYAQSNGITVLANTNDVQAAADRATGAAGFNFWTAGSVDMPESATYTSLTNVTADSAASVTLWNEAGTLHIGVSDPTQKQSTVTVTLKGEGITPAKVRAVGTVTAIEGGVVVTADVSGLRGATVSATAYDSTGAALDAMQNAESFLNRSDLAKSDADEGQTLLDALDALDDSTLSDAQKADLAALRGRLVAKVEELKNLPDPTPTPAPAEPTPTPAPADNNSGNSSTGSSSGSNSNSTTATATPAPAAAATAQPKAQASAAIPQTSDVFPLEALLAVLTVSGVAAAGLFIFRKKKNQ